MFLTLTFHWCVSVASFFEKNQEISIFPTPSTQVPEILLHSFMCFDLGHSHVTGSGWTIGRLMYVLDILKDTKMVLDPQNLQVHQTPTIKSYTPEV